MKGKLKNGFEYTVSDKLNDDYELLELSVAAQNEDIKAVVDMMERVFGKKQLKKLKEHIRDENGIVSTQALTEALAEVMEKAAKN